MLSTIPTTELAPFTTSQIPQWSTMLHTTSRDLLSSLRMESKCTIQFSTTWQSSRGCQTRSSTLTSILQVSGLSTPTTNSATTPVQVSFSLKNLVSHHVSGGTHLCFWLRPARVPDGPSYTQNFCPFKVFTISSFLTGANCIYIRL